MHTISFICTRYFSLALVGVLCFACDTTSTSETEETDSLEVSDLFSEYPTKSGERKSIRNEDPLDFAGTYTGMLPCADCAGIKTEIQITDSSFIKRTIYLGEGRPDLYEASGGASWDNATQILTLGGIAPPNRYLVQENTLTQLDRKGKKVTGRLADRYVLQKE